MKYIVLIYCLFSLHLAGQINDGLSGEILNKAKERYESYPNFVLSFELEIENADAGIDEYQAGDITVSGVKYKLVTDELTQFCNGTTIWTYFAEDEEVHLTSFIDDELVVSPHNMFRIWEKGYSGKYRGEVELDGFKFHEIELVPLMREPPVLKIILRINKHTDIITEVSALNKNGTRYTYKVLKLDTRISNLENTTFEFNPSLYPNQDIDEIDLR